MVVHVGKYWSGPDVSNALEKSTGRIAASDPNLCWFGILVTSLIGGKHFSNVETTQSQLVDVLQGAGRNYKSLVCACTYSLYRKQLKPDL